MNKAFIFDMDGVIVDTESAWVPHDKQIIETLFEPRVRDQIGSTIGLGIRGVFEKAHNAGSAITFETLAAAYRDAAREIYNAIQITEGTDHLIDRLATDGFKIGLVTSSAKEEIDKVLSKLTSRSKFDVLISLYDEPELRPKPSPDGYIQAMKVLNADPSRSFVLEDSNYGIASGKAAGCFVIGFRGCLIDGYEQIGADAYADTMQDVERIVSIRP